MRGVLLFLECLFVFLLIPLLGMELWNAKANSLVQKGDALLMSDPKEAVLLYQKADTVCFGGSTLASNRLRVCKSYGVGLDGTLGEEFTRSVFRDRNGNFENEATFEREYPGGRRCFSDRWSDKGCADLTMEEATYDLPDEVIDKFKERHPTSEYLYSYNDLNGPFHYRTENLTFAAKTLSFLRSLEKMPRLEDDCERKLWEDSSELPKVRRVLIARIRALAEDGCVWAQKEYALCYQTGDCVQQSSSEALKWYLEAAKQGDATAAVIVACWYRDGKSVEKNESEMVSWLKEASKHGDADAEFLLAQCYEAGRGVSKDVKVAFELYRSAATRGHVKACSLLGIRFINSTDKKERKEAFSWLEKATVGGDIDATTRIGICYYEGEGVKTNMKKAFPLFLKAAKAGDVEAQFRLGCCYCDGDGVLANVKEGLLWIETAAERGHVNAQVVLGACYKNGICAEKDPYQSFKWYKKAANMKNEMAMMRVAEAYLAGSGVAKNEREAARWFQSVIEVDSKEPATKTIREKCQIALGRLYLRGKGLGKDEDKAVTLFRDAAKTGSVDAQYWVGVCYSNGFGVMKNPYTAFSWYKKAAEQNNAQGQVAVAFSYLVGDGVTRDVDMGYSLAKKSADQGYSGGQYLLGLCYEYGYGREGNAQNRPDTAKALVWYRKAAEQGEERAKEKVRSLSSCNYN